MFGWLQPHLRVTLIVFSEKVSLVSLQHCRNVDADAWYRRALKYITFTLLVAGIQSVSVPGQLVYLSEERVAFHNVPMYSRARRMFVMTNQSPEHTTHFEWHVTSLKDSQVHVFFHCSKGSFILERKRRHYYWVHRESNLLFALKHQHQRQRSKTKSFSL